MFGNLLKSAGQGLSSLYNSAKNVFSPSKPRSIIPTARAQSPPRSLSSTAYRTARSQAYGQLRANPGSEIRFGSTPADNGQSRYFVQKQEAPVKQAPTFAPRSGYSSYSAPQSTYSSPGYNIPSAEEAAKKYSDMQAAKYGEIVAPKEAALRDYLASRQPYSQVYEGKINELGVPDQMKNLTALEKQIGTATEDLEKYPKEDIERRQETGMLSEAARRAVRVATAAPIQERLIGLGRTANTTQLGLDRALSLAREKAQNYLTDTQQGEAPLRADLESARSQFGMVVDGIAQQFTGFTQDREAALRKYEAAEERGFRLSQEQAQESAQLKQQEAEQVQTMQMVSNVSEDVKNNTDLSSIVSKYVSSGFDPNAIISLYKSLVGDQSGGGSSLYSNLEKIPYGG